MFLFVSFRLIFTSECFNAICVWFILSTCAYLTSCLRCISSIIFYWTFIVLSFGCDYRESSVFILSFSQLYYSALSSFLYVNRLSFYWTSILLTVFRLLWVCRVLWICCSIFRFYCLYWVLYLLSCYPFFVLSYFWLTCCLDVRRSSNLSWIVWCCVILA